MKKPMIVLSPQAMPMEKPFQNSYHYTNCFHTAAVQNAGGIPVLPPFLSQADAEELMEEADGLYLTGGEDVNPALYGEEKLPCCGSFSPDRDQSDIYLLAAAVKFQKPVLCICRGSQIANVYFGGSLYQDLPTQRCLPIDHSQYHSYSQPAAHAVTLVQDTPLAQLLPKQTFPVNSLHHQAVKCLASPLAPMAWSEDGILEAWYLPGYAQWMWGVQWHPEMIPEREESKAIFAAFLKACKDRR